MYQYNFQIIYICLFHKVLFQLSFYVSTGSSPPQVLTASGRVIYHCKQPSIWNHVSVYSLHLLDDINLEVNAVFTPMGESS